MRTRPFVVAALSAVATIAALAACAGYGASSDTPGAAADGGGDAADALEAADAGGDAPSDGDVSAGPAPNLLPNGDFEIGCADWRSESGTLTEDTTAHTGAKSCRLCATPTDAATARVNMYSIVVLPIAVGDRFVAAAFVRRAPDAPPPDAIAMELLTSDRADGAYATVDDQTTNCPALSETWQRMSVVVGATGRADAIIVGILAEAPSTGCVLVDDVTLTR